MKVSFGVIWIFSLMDSIKSIIVGLKPTVFSKIISHFFVNQGEEGGGGIGALL